MDFRKLPPRTLLLMPANRRDFLKRALGASTLLGLSPAVPGWLCRAAGRELRPPGGDTVLVVVQLAGGNDGLNTVVPYADDHYARSAANAAARREGRPARSTRILGFHPGMPAFARLLPGGALDAWCRAWAIRNPNQSHETSMRIWQTARPEDAAAQTGWLGGAADCFGGRADRRARDLRGPDCPAIYAARADGHCALDPRRRRTARCGCRLVVQARACRDKARRETPAPQSTLLEHVQRTAAAARLASRRIEQVVEAADRRRVSAAAVGRHAPHDRPVDPRRRRHPHLTTPSWAAEEPGGFDNHANQRDNHASLLRQLSQSVGGLRGRPAARADSWTACC